MIDMMHGASGTIVQATGLFTLNVFAAAMLLSMVRLLRGPTLADRVVALDLIAALAVGVIAVYSILTEQPMLLRAGIVVALVIFVGTVAFAMFLEKRGRL
jgi:multicomponent Na+:H+ antiporter subunit F